MQKSERLTSQIGLMQAWYVQACRCNSAIHPRRAMRVTWYGSPSSPFHEGDLCLELRGDGFGNIGVEREHRTH